jgi:hypothetical protein
VADPPIPELVENRRRSIAMLAGSPALNRDEALEVRQLVEVLRELWLRKSDEGDG